MLSLYIKRMVIIVFLLLMILGYTPQCLIASPRLPNVTSEMERPEFWIKKIKNPTNLLLTPGKIQKMNEENLKRKDLLLFRIKDLKEDWTREEILSLLKRDWEDFGEAKEVRYGKKGAPLRESYWTELKNKLNQDSIKESNRMLYALVVKRTDIRVFPTDEPSLSSPNNEEFDRFQHSSISSGSPIGIYHFSKDNEWAYVQTSFIRGWIHTKDLAIANEKHEVTDYEEAQDRLVVIGNFINVFGDSSLQKIVFLAQMGDIFPLLSTPGETNITNSFYIIQIPSNDANGQLIFRKGYIRADEDVRRGFLPYTQENVARQSFKMLNHPYDWGDRLGGRDCSRFIMDLFKTFGILMPRNSREQANVGIDLGKSLNQAIPLATILRVPGHIMLYLGNNKGKYYIIHSILGTQDIGKSGIILEKIGKVVVSDLSLGRSGPHGSLLNRLTGIRFIGEKNRFTLQR